MKPTAYRINLALWLAALATTAALALLDATTASIQPCKTIGDTWCYVTSDTAPRVRPAKLV